MDIKKTIDKEQYKEEVKQTMPKSRLLRECIFAFVVGGLICVLGQGVLNFGKYVLMLDKEGASGFTAIIMIFLGAFFTGLGIYDVLGRFAGAGSIVPITGFANSIVSPALDYKREGFILGVGAKLFSIAGPVLVYGISASVIAGIIYWIFGGK
jgi:stage V sporulation protein AC